MADNVKFISDNMLLLLTVMLQVLSYFGYPSSYSIFVKFFLLKEGYVLLFVT